MSAVNNDNFYNSIKTNIAARMRVYFTGTIDCNIIYRRKKIPTTLTKPVIRFFIIDQLPDAIGGQRTQGKNGSGNEQKGIRYTLSYNIIVTTTRDAGGEKKRDLISLELNKFANTYRSAFGTDRIKKFDISAGIEIMPGDDSFFQNLHVITCEYNHYTEA